MEDENIKDFNTSLKWWEKKRIVYNCFTLLGGLLVPMLRSCVPNGIISYSHFWLIFFWLFGANIFYTCSWTIEVLLNYYVKVPFWNRQVKWIVFVLGTIFSFIWMFLLTRTIEQ